MARRADRRVEPGLLAGPGRGSGRADIGATESGGRRRILATMLGPYGVQTPRILIVGDDPNLLVLLAEQLRGDGYDVQTARDGDEALRRLTQSWPDLLV